MIKNKTLQLKQMHPYSIAFGLYKLAETISMIKSKKFRRNFKQPFVKRCTCQIDKGALYTLYTLYTHHYITSQGINMCQIY